jgi:tRNA threonylcarbamoyladenosine biosynthesis protein TsaE
MNGIPKKAQLSGGYLNLSEEQVISLGTTWGLQCAQGTAFFLQGELGVGKTVLAKAIGNGLGVLPEEMRSPSFSILNTHHGSSRILHHLDLYRLESAKLDDIGVEELFDEDSVIIIEWPDRAEYLSSFGGTWVKIQYTSDPEKRTLWVYSIEEEV